MYKITYVHWGETAENTLYIPGDNDYCLISGTLKLGCGQSGELDITVPINNPAREGILCLTDEVIVYRDNEELWRGRPITQQLDFNMSGQLTCEGILSYLYDTYYPPYDFSGSPNDLLADIIANHNSNTDEQKHFTLGNVTVTDPNDYIARSSIDYNRTMDVLADKFSGSSLGGYFRVRISGGVRYLDYLETYGTTATQDVEYGSNILDIAQSIEYSNLATVILPLGARLTDESGIETDERLTIASVNGGSIYYTDEGAAASYGKITVCATWDDVTVASNLLEKAQDYLEQVTSAVSSFEVNAVDLSLISDDYVPINLGDHVRIYSEPHGINQYAELTELDIDLLNPSNDILRFGTQAASLTSSQASTSRSIQTALNSEAKRVTNLVADTVTTEYLSANYATIEYLNAQMEIVQDLYVTYEEVDTLVAGEVYTVFEQADVLTAGDLTAIYASIGTLEADTASIKNLLAVTEVAGELVSVHLSTDNAVIDSAVIVNAVADTILAELITASYINTDVITVKSEDGGITIIGNQMQVVDGQLLFYDENGTVRMQIGQDATGNFTFVLYDETGTGVMIDSEGIHASAISDGLIVDAMVADDAGIQGSKLDIEDVAQCLTEDGSLIVSASQVTINNTTLDAAYTEIIQTMEGLEGLTSEGLMKITTYFCLWYSDEDAPPFSFDGMTEATCGIAVCGETICGVYSLDDIWSTDRKVAGENTYLWVCYLGEYVDGHTEWTEPYCVTDGYLREQTEVLQTSFKVVQGEIDARIWQTDIDESFNALDGKITTVEDQYSELNMTVDGISASVGDLSSTVSNNYTILSEQVGELTVTVNNIELRVSDVQNEIGTYYEEYTSKVGELTVTTEEIKASVTSVESSVTGIQSNIEDIEAEIAGMEGIEDFTPYFCLWYSGYEAPPNDEDLTKAICGTAVCGTTVCGVTDGILWQEEQPYTEDDSLYLWVKYKLEFQDGEESWKGPYCLSDVATRKETKETWAYIDVLEGSITEEVGSLYTYVDGEITYVSSQVASLQIETDNITSRVSSAEGSITGLQKTTDDLEKELSELDGLESFTAYFCLWYSGTETPPADDELTAATCGMAVCGTTVCGVTGSYWTTKEPTAGDGSYKWIKYYLVFEDETTGWSDPYCLTDEYARSEIKNCYSEIEQLADSITMTVDSDEYGKAVIKMSANGKNIGSAEYVYEARKAFENSDTSIEVKAGTIAFIGNTLVVSSNQFELDADGNAIFSGALSAASGTFAGELVAASGTFAGELVAASGTFAGELVAATGEFSGRVTASNGTIGGWTITKNQIYSGSGHTFVCLDSSTSDTAIYAGGEDEDTSPFWLSNSGEVWMTECVVTGYINIHRNTGNKGMCGEIGYMSGVSDYGSTDGVGVAYKRGDYSADYYIIATDSGVRMQAKNTAFSVVDGKAELANADLYIPDGNVYASQFGNDTYYFIATTSGVRMQAGSANAWMAPGNGFVVECDLTVNGTINDASDERLKADITPLDDAYSIVLDNLLPISYRYTRNAEKLHMGFTTQNVQAALTEAGLNPDDYGILSEVEHDDGCSYGALAYDEILAILVHEIQSLKKKVEAMA